MEAEPMPTIGTCVEDPEAQPKVGDMRQVSELARRSPSHGEPQPQPPLLPQISHLESIGHFWTNQGGENLRGSQVPSPAPTHRVRQ